MVNSRLAHLRGRRITEHPLADEGGALLVTSRREAGQFLAIEAPVSGRIETDRGMESFQPGDYVVSDFPVTFAWPVRRDTFKVTFTPVEDPYVMAGKEIKATHAVVVDMTNPEDHVVIDVGAVAEPEPQVVATAKGPVTKRATRRRRATRKT